MSTEAYEPYGFSIGCSVIDLLLASLAPPVHLGRHLVAVCGPR